MISLASLPGGVVISLIVSLAYFLSLVLLVALHLLYLDIHVDGFLALIYDSVGFLLHACCLLGLSLLYIIGLTVL